MITLENLISVLGVLPKEWKTHSIQFGIDGEMLINYGKTPYFNSLVMILPRKNGRYFLSGGAVRYELIPSLAGRLKFPPEIDVEIAETMELIEWQK